jgi:hypothetical protein
MCVLDFHKKILKILQVSFWKSSILTYKFFFHAIWIKITKIHVKIHVSKMTSFHNQKTALLHSKSIHKILRYMWTISSTYFHLCCSQCLLWELKSIIGYQRCFYMCVCTYMQIHVHIYLNNLANFLKTAITLWVHTALQS